MFHPISLYEAKHLLLEAAVSLQPCSRRCLLQTSMCGVNRKKLNCLMSVKHHWGTHTHVHTWIKVNLHQTTSSSQNGFGAVECQASYSLFLQVLITFGRSAWQPELIPGGPEGPGSPGGPGNPSLPGGPTGPGAWEAKMPAGVFCSIADLESVSARWEFDCSL